MSAMQLIQQMRANEPAAGTRSGKTQTGFQANFDQAVKKIVHILLADEPVPEAPLSEASVHLPRRGSIWMATFTGPAGGQVWRSTGSTDRGQALMLARYWEAQARAQRAKLSRTHKGPILRVRRHEPGTARS